jgi:hypothetical protein
VGFWSKLKPWVKTTRQQTHNKLLPSGCIVFLITPAAWAPEITETFEAAIKSSVPYTCYLLLFIIDIAHPDLCRVINTIHRVATQVIAFIGRLYKATMSTFNGIVEGMTPFINPKAIINMIWQSSRTSGVSVDVTFLDLITSLNDYKSIIFAKIPTSHLHWPAF